MQASQGYVRVVKFGLGGLAQRCVASPQRTHSCRFQPSETEVVEQECAVSLKGSRHEGSSTGQSKKQILTLAEIRVHIMLLVSNLWMSFEKQSAWKTAGQPNYQWIQQTKI